MGFSCTLLHLHASHFFYSTQYASYNSPIASHLISHLLHHIMSSHVGNKENKANKVRKLSQTPKNSSTTAPRRAAAALLLLAALRL